MRKKKENESLICSFLVGINFSNILLSYIKNGILSIPFFTSIFSLLFFILLVFTIKRRKKNE